MSAGREEPLVEARDLVVRYPSGGTLRRTWILPVRGISFSVPRGGTVALVGESGSGKTTTGNALARIVEPHAGSVRLLGKDVTHIRGAALRQYYGQVQMVFQDPFASLNPSRTVGQHLMAPIRAHHPGTSREMLDRADSLLQKVGLLPPEEIREKYPHELSGGQRQRVAIARALAVNPVFLVADEPVSMLDVSIRANILALLDHLKREFHLSILYITHDLASARHMADTILVMFGGHVVEEATATDLVRSPRHPYTRQLLAATPGAFWDDLPLEVSQEPPDLSDGRVGCPYANRCQQAEAICHQVMPPTTEPDPGHRVACHLYSGAVAVRVDDANKH